MAREGDTGAGGEIDKEGPSWGGTAGGGGEGKGGGGGGKRGQGLMRKRKWRRMRTQ